MHKGGDDVNDLARLFQVERGGGDPFGYVLHQRDEALEVADDVALDRFGFVVLLLQIRLERDMRGEVRLLLRELADGYTLKPLHDNLDGTIGHAYHTRNARDSTHAEDVVGSCLFGLGGTTRRSPRMTSSMRRIERS